jgi:hypothetical protein
VPKRPEVAKTDLMPNTDGPLQKRAAHLGFGAMHWSDVTELLPVAGSCLVMIVAQSAATARAYATHLIGLSAANAAAAFSGTFVVNGSPTQTAMVEGSGGTNQIAQLATASLVALVLLFLTGTAAVPATRCSRRNRVHIRGEVDQSTWPRFDSSRQPSGIFASRSYGHDRRAA